MRSSIERPFYWLDVCRIGLEALSCLYPGIIFLLALAQSLEQAFRLIDVFLGGFMVGVELRHVAPLGDGGLEFLLTVKPNSLAVVLLDQLSSRPSQ
jgi:hypothetical protein